MACLHCNEVQNKNCVCLCTLYYGLYTIYGYYPLDRLLLVRFMKKSQILSKTTRSNEIEEEKRLQLWCFSETGLSLFQILYI